MELLITFAIAFYLGRRFERPKARHSGVLRWVPQYQRFMVFPKE